MRKRQSQDKYNFNTVSFEKRGNNTNNDNNDNKGTSFFETIKKWLTNIFKFLTYHWKYNRFMFILIMCILFLLGYYIYVNYIQEENEYKEDNDKDDKDNEEALNDFVKTTVKKKKKTIPKKHETRCRVILENLFKIPFTTVRPDFLRYDKTGKNLELDMYNPDLMLALEYDGVHHRKFTEFFHKTHQDFDEQQERDKYKEERCRELGITLIRVPDTVKYNDLEDYIKKELDNRGIIYFKD